MPLFRSKLGLIAATVGSAVGLGTVWRFPAEVQSNGGGAFLLIYTACVFLLGVPIMLSEFALGRGERSDAVGVFRKQSPHTAWWLVGLGAVIAPFIILCFYMVVGGWTLDYLVHSLNGSLFTGVGDTIAESDRFFTDKMLEAVSSPWRAPLYTALFIILNIVVLLGGVQKGIERLANISMPMLFVILLALCGISLTLPGAADGVRFFLEPDFSRITPTVCINALGQALFSLSLGMGILVTYASYYSDKTNLGSTSLIVSSLTLLIALMMGLLIFPAVKTFGLADHGLSGTTLVFVTLPEVFKAMGYATVSSSLFFMLLLIAALTSTVSIAEVCIRFLQERFGVTRQKGVFIVLVPVIFLAGICSLSFGPLSDFLICGKTIFDFLDEMTNNYLLPLVAMGTCIYMGWFSKKGFFRNQLTNGGKIWKTFASVTSFVVKWFAPVAILVILVANIVR